MYLSIFFQERMLITLCVYIHLHKKKVLAIDEFLNATKILKIKKKKLKTDIKTRSEIHY